MAHGRSMNGQQPVTAIRHANIPLAISFVLVLLFEFLMKGFNNLCIYT